MKSKPVKTTRPAFIPRIRNVGQSNWKFYQYGMYLIVNDGQTWNVFDFRTQKIPQWASASYDTRKAAIAHIDEKGS